MVGSDPLSLFVWLGAVKGHMGPDELSGTWAVLEEVEPMRSG